jgi:predicted DNA-binding antitoxin AbrB/MazE fold protein
MLETIPAVVRDGKIELLEKVDVPEGARLLVTVLPDEDKEFWLGASQSSLGKVWDNAEDDVYEKLLEG